MTFVNELFVLSVSRRRVPGAEGRPQGPRQQDLHGDRREPGRRPLPGGVPQGLPQGRRAHAPHGATFHRPHRRVRVKPFKKKLK